MSIGRRTIDASSAGLRWLREREGRVIVLGTVLGLVLAYWHYVGLVVGGLLVGLPARSVKRALVFGLAFGLLAWLLFVGWLATNGALPAFVGMGELAALNVGIALGLPTLGALAARCLS